MLSVEDLLARTTAFVCGRLRRGETIDLKHAVAFDRLRGLGQTQVLAAAWNDHRQHVAGTLEDASREAVRLLEAHPELIVVEECGTPRSTRREAYSWRRSCQRRLVLRKTFFDSLDRPLCFSRALHRGLMPCAFSTVRSHAS